MRFTIVVVCRCRDVVRRQEGRELLGDADGADTRAAAAVGMQKVLCMFRWHTSAPHLPGDVRPHCAFKFAPSM